MKLLKITVALLFSSLLAYPIPSASASESNWSPFKKKKKNQTEQTTSKSKEDEEKAAASHERTQQPESQTTSENVAVNPAYIEDDNWMERVSMQPYDSLLHAWREQSAYRTFESFFNDFINIDDNITVPSDIPDAVYEERLKKIISPIPMPYNDEVKRFIVTYTTTRKSTMARILGRSQYYFPMIEAELDRAKMPMELRMLAAIESALIPEARSRVGATGLWQFMLATGKSYGLEVNSFVDERCDPLLATKAACKYLQYLYNLYNDWLLALAAYNCGPGNVNKALNKVDGDNSTKSFWDIYPFLPKETRQYVPSFIGATYAYTYHKQHDIEPICVMFPLATDTLMIHDKLLHLEQVSSTIGTSMDVLRALNPQYKLDIIPAVLKDYPLTLPSNDVSKFLANETLIYSKDSLYLKEYLDPANFDPEKIAAAKSVQVTVYKVKSGDTLSAIASRYGVTVKQLKQWNNLKSDKLSIGQRIEIHK